jgi:hypothetical protein
LQLLDLRIFAMHISGSTAGRSVRCSTIND